MAEWLKRGAAADVKAEADRKVRDIVAGSFADIKARGDVAVREMSIRFDEWGREVCRLSQAEIDQVAESLTPHERKDIEYARAQLRNRPGRCARSNPVRRVCWTRSSWSGLALSKP